ncbi:hypothetical protein [Dactylosporangium sp. NPDC005555]|uniref:hypothetical protein n=1 Tax=Dactylosporangium sp. NPDC005555 TaxID=3154889 RepID=UPI0033B417B2
MASSGPVGWESPPWPAAYRLCDRLSEGGVFETWQAHDELLDREVAVKVLAGKFAADAGLHDRVLREARAAAGLSHPNVAGVYDYGETPDHGPYVVMEPLRGPALAARLAGNPRPDRPIRAIGIFAGPPAAEVVEQFRTRRQLRLAIAMSAAAAVILGSVLLTGDARAPQGLAGGMPGVTNPEQPDWTSGPPVSPSPPRSEPRPGPRVREGPECGNVPDVLIGHPAVEPCREDRFPCGGTGSSMRLVRTFAAVLAAVTLAVVPFPSRAVPFPWSGKATAANSDGTIAAG